MYRKEQTIVKVKMTFSACFSKEKLRPEYEEAYVPLESAKRNSRIENEYRARKSGSTEMIARSSEYETTQESSRERNSSDSEGPFNGSKHIVWTIEDIKNEVHAGSQQLSSLQRELVPLQ